MTIARGPQSVKVEKITGHATHEMVAEGSVRPGDKAGNDQADAAAARGSKAEQSSLHSLTQLFAKRQFAHQKEYGENTHIFLWQ